MHHEAMQWVARAITQYDLDQVGVEVLDLGGRDVNGTTEMLWAKPGRYYVVDLSPHPSVDIVGDAADLAIPERFDVVTSTECLEHTERAPEIVKKAREHLKPGGVFIATMAGPGRPEHGQHGEPRPGEDEFYRNVSPSDLQQWLMDAGFSTWQIDHTGLDVRCVAFY